MSYYLFTGNHRQLREFGINRSHLRSTLVRHMQVVIIRSCLTKSLKSLYWQLIYKVLLLQPVQGVSGCSVGTFELVLNCGIVKLGSTSCMSTSYMSQCNFLIMNYLKFSEIQNKNYKYLYLYDLKSVIEIAKKLLKITIYILEKIH